MIEAAETTVLDAAVTTGAGPTCVIGGGTVSPVHDAATKTRATHNEARTSLSYRPAGASVTAQNPGCDGNAEALDMTFAFVGKRQWKSQRFGEKRQLAADAFTEKRHLTGSAECRFPVAIKGVGEASVGVVMRLVYPLVG